MKQNEIQIGHFYAVRLHGAPTLSVVRVDEAVTTGGVMLGFRITPERTNWKCTNTVTGRTIRVRGAAKFRYEVVKNAAGNWERKV